MNNYGQTPLHLAAEYGTLEIVQFMVDERNFEFSSEKGYTPLHCAARGGKLDIVKYLIEKKGYNPNGYLSRTPLNSACHGGKYDTVEYLIRECGVDPSLRDDHGNTSLHSAVYSGQISIIELLVAEFDNENDAFDNRVRDAASFAKEKGHKDIFIFLENSKRLHQGKLVK